MGQLGFGELLLIALIILLVVGSKRLPEVGRSLGEAIREFQRAMKGEDHGSESDKDSKEK